MNGFTKKSVGTLTLGEKLRKLRMDKRISLGEVSRLTKIQVKYLEYMEADEYEKLPADVYAKGFLRSYADFFGVDEKILLRLYEKEKEIRKNLKKGDPHSLDEKKSINISSFVFTPGKIIASVIIVLVLAGLFFLYKEIGSFSSEPRLIILSPEDNSEIPGNSATIEGITEKDALLFINGQSIMISDEGKFRENLTLQSGVNIVNIKSVNKFEKESVKTITLRSSAKEENNEGESSADENKNQAENANQKKIKMELRVDPGPVWLSVEADENLVFSGTMLSGAIQSFEADNKIVVNSGKGDSTFVTFNGKDIGALNEEPGAVRGVTFDRNTQY